MCDAAKKIATLALDSAYDWIIGLTECELHNGYGYKELQRGHT